MASGPDVLTFFDSFHNGMSSSLHHVIQDTVRGFSASQRSQMPRHSPPCLLQEMGDFLVEVLKTLSHLVKVIIRETYIPQHIRRRLSIQVEKDDLTDLSYAKYMDKKYDALMAVGNRVDAAASGSAAIWNGAQSNSTVHQSVAHSLRSPGTTSGGAASWSDTHRAPPRLETSFSTSSTMTGYTVPGSVMRSDATYATMGAIPTSPLSADNDLRARGKGQYTCPLGFDCRKGGVDSHGNLTMFERNSSFRSHMQKHEKPFRCNLAGCTNTEGFAREDQLLRHQQNTRHGRALQFVPNARPNHVADHSSQRSGRR